MPIRPEEVDSNTHKPIYKTVKTSLKYALDGVRGAVYEDRIKHAVLMINEIVTRGTLFLKLFLLHHPDTDLTEHLILNIFRTVSERTESRGAPPQQKSRTELATLRAFYANHFENLLPDDDELPDPSSLAQPLIYAARHILTDYKNNVIANYVSYVERYVNVRWKKNELTELFQLRAAEKIENFRRYLQQSANRYRYNDAIAFFRRRIESEKNSRINRLVSTLRQVKSDILNVAGDPFTSPPCYHAWIRLVKLQILPSRQRFEKNLILYDIQCRPLDYFVPMMTMAQEIEAAGATHGNVCPFRRTFIPKHITLDSVGMIRLLYPRNIGLGTQKEMLQNLTTQKKDDVWALFFQTGKKAFKMKGYVFNHMIQTDGVSCSILLIQAERLGEISIQEKFIKKETYIEEIGASERVKLRKRQVVGVDPGLGNLLYASKETTPENRKDAREVYMKFRYSYVQRRKETKSSKFQNIMFQHKKRRYTFGRSVLDWEQHLAGFNGKSVNVQTFSDYVREKLLVSSIVASFYENVFYRKFKLHVYINAKKSEQWMVNKFRHIFGHPPEVVIGIGDWEQRKHRKFKEPRKGVGLRTTLRRAGYKVFLVDEFRTSLQCSNCRTENAKCVPFLHRMDPDERKQNRRMQEFRGVLRCQECDTYWNRDHNAAINIARLTRDAIDGRERAEYLRRPQTISQQPQQQQRIPRRRTATSQRQQRNPRRRTAIPQRAPIQTTPAPAQRNQRSSSSSSAI